MEARRCGQWIIRLYQKLPRGGWGEKRKQDLPINNSSIAMLDTLMVRR